ncbi:MAG: PEP-CTERM sorting domain-containing protein [Planctomycetota bacterium]|nr:PEP-CTERM sorting domain-containing protein [Planctomycetota bacterium]
MRATEEKGFPVPAGIGLYGKCRFIEERRMQMRLIVIGAILPTVVLLGDACGDTFLPTPGCPTVAALTYTSTPTPDFDTQLWYGTYAESHGAGGQTGAGFKIGPTSFYLAISGNPSKPYNSEAGWVFYLDGSLTLGQLQGVTINSTLGMPTVKLWLDKGGDGGFFSWVYGTSGLGGYTYYWTGPNGDVSLTGTPGNVYGSTVFGGPSGDNYTLADLQAGACSGIDANTKVALWIGIYGNPSFEEAAFSEVNVQTPEPATMSLLALGGLAILRRKR